MDGQNQPSNVSQDTNFAQNATNWQTVPPPVSAQPSQSSVQPAQAVPTNLVSSTVPPSGNYSAIGGKKTIKMNSILSWVIFIVLALIIIAGTGYYVLFYSKNTSNSLSDAINVLLGRPPVLPFPEAPPEITPPVGETPPVIPDTAPPVAETAPPTDTGTTGVEDELEKVNPDELDDFEGIEVPQ